MRTLPTRSVLLVSAIAVLCAGPAASAPATPKATASREHAPRVAVDVAKKRASRHYGGARVNATFSLRSSRDRRWALVDGRRSGGRTIWAVWVRKDSRGTWRAIYFTDRAHRGAYQPRREDRGRVPCDITPAYSEPSC